MKRVMHWVVLVGRGILFTLDAMNDYFGIPIAVAGGRWVNHIQTPTNYG